MNITLWMIFGALAGWIASMSMAANARRGALANIVVGIVGAVIGGFIGFAFTPSVTGFNLTSLIVAVLGAVVLLFLVGLAQPKNTGNLTVPAQEKQSSVSPKIQSKIETLSSPKPSARKVSSGIIFMSYRRADSADVAGRIYDRFLGAFGKVAVFKDVDSIPLGLDFKQYLNEKVGERNVLLAIIGDRWLEVSDSMGRKRLEDPSDFVRIEIEAALARNIPVIPVLVRGAALPEEEKLPAGLKKLVNRNGIEIRSDPDFHRDMDRLISGLKGMSSQQSEPSFSSSANKFL